jgi:hypothetical protein
MNQAEPEIPPMNDCIVNVHQAFFTASTMKDRSSQVINFVAAHHQLPSMHWNRRREIEPRFKNPWSSARREKFQGFQTVRDAR